MGQRALRGSGSRMLPPSSGAEHRGCRDGRAGQGPTHPHRCTNTHRKIKICFKKKKFSYTTQGRSLPIGPAVAGMADAALTNCSLTLPLSRTWPLCAHPLGAPQKSFTIIYSHPLLLRLLAEAALGFSAVEEPGGAPGGRPDPAPVRGESCAGSRHLRGRGRGLGTVSCFLAPFLPLFLAFSFFPPSASEEINPIYYLLLSKCVSLPWDARRIRNSPLTEN